jgi:hypothetical protein
MIYRVRCKGTINGSDPNDSTKSAIAPVDYDLRDPCDSAGYTVITPSNPSDTTYTITDDSKPDFEFPEFTVLPDFCNVAYDV